MAAETLILTHEQIAERIRRIAWQIYEDNCDESRVVIIGIPKSGLVISSLIEKELKQISSLSVQTGELKAAPSGYELSVDVEGLSVILVDDVLNSGRTMMEAAAAIVAKKPRQLRTAILANRDHKRFPIAADYVGISLATTLQEHISFNSRNPKKLSVTLD